MDAHHFSLTRIDTAQRMIYFLPVSPDQQEEETVEHGLGPLDQRTLRHSRGPIASLRRVANPRANQVALYVHVEKRRGDFSASESQRPTSMGSGGTHVTKKSPKTNPSRPPQRQRVYCYLVDTSRSGMCHVEHDESVHLSVPRCSTISLLEPTNPTHYTAVSQ